jgi:hypothetical protein
MRITSSAFVALIDGNKAGRNERTADERVPGGWRWPPILDRCRSPAETISSFYAKISFKHRFLPKSAINNVFPTYFMANIQGYKRKLLLTSTFHLESAAFPTVMFDTLFLL